MLALQGAGVLAEGAVTAAYSYIGPELTHPMYKDGSIGRAKDHLFATAAKLAQEIPGLRSYLSVNKALVTQSSAAIPIVPLYISLLYRVMKEKGLHLSLIHISSTSRILESTSPLGPVSTAPAFTVTYRPLAFWRTCWGWRSMR